MLSFSPVGLQTLQGRRVRLERVKVEHAPLLLQWYQNKEFMDLYRLTENRAQSLKELETRLAKELQLQPEQLKRIEWLIFHQATQNSEAEPIGLVSLADYKPTYRRAEFLIGIIDESHRATGASLEATLLALDFAFNQINLHKLIAYIYGHNHYAQKNILNFGFKQEGFLRQHMLNAEYGYIDIYIDAMLEPEFRTDTRIARLARRAIGRDITQKAPKAIPLSPNELSQSKEQLAKVLRQAQSQNQV